MVVRIHKLNEQGERYKSYRSLIKVTKVEEKENKLYIHTYFSDNCGDPVEVIDLDKHGVEMFIGRY